MRHYRVVVTRSTVQRAGIDLFATSQDEAERLAWERARDDDVLWEIDEVDINASAQGDDYGNRN